MLTSSIARAAAVHVGVDGARTRFATEQLGFLLQLAYSGELAAIRAYLGHRASLKDRAQRRALDRIIRDEVRHRHCVLGQLAELGAGPFAARERKMERVGRAISTFCLLGGWFAPMYGAGRLEAQNIREYEVAARLALVAERVHFVDPLLEMAEVEWDHERWFRAMATAHPAWRVFPTWRQPPPREDIRASFAAFERSTDRPLHVVRAPWLVR